MAAKKKDSTITIAVQLDEHKVPEKIKWTATDSTADDMQVAKAMLVNFWDGNDKAALRIDLWTQEMMIDEMVDFYYQNFLGMAETLERSTGEKALANDLRDFAKSFFQKFQESQRNQQSKPA